MRPRIANLCVVGGIVVLGTGTVWALNHLPTDPQTLELRKSQQETLRLRKELAEATASLKTQRVISEQALQELEIARKTTHQVVREVYRDNGTLQARTTETESESTRQSEKQSASKTETVRFNVTWTVKTATETVLVDRTSDEVKKNDSRLGLGLGVIASGDHLGFTLAKSVGSLWMIDLDVLAGIADRKPLAGVGASVEVMPRLSLGAAYQVSSDLRHGPVLTIQHRF